MTCRKKEAKIILKRKILIKNKRKKNTNNGTEDNYKDKGIKKTKKLIIQELIIKRHPSLKSLHKMKKKSLENLLKTFIESGCQFFQIIVPHLNIIDIDESVL